MVDSAFCFSHLVFAANFESVANRGKTECDWLSNLDLGLPCLVSLVRCEREYVSTQLMSKEAREILSCTKSQGKCD
jgi:hypothetical protein